MNDTQTQLDAWIDAHFADEVRFLQALIRVPTDTPPGNNTPHALRTRELLSAMGLQATAHEVPAAQVQAAGMQSITNLIVRREYGSQPGDGPTIALNAHGDVVPPGEGWTRDPYGGEIEGDLQTGRIFGRAAAVSKSDFASFTFALRALEAVAKPRRGAVELMFTYDEEFGGELGPGWLLKHGHSKPDFVIAAGFSHEVVVAHNGCLQLEVTLHGEMAHAAIPHTGVDALQTATAVLAALYADNERLKTIRSSVEGITHPYLNIGRIEGGTNTNVVPGKVTLKLDRRMIPEENPADVEPQVRTLIERAAQAHNPRVRVEIKRLLLAHSMQPLPGNAPLVGAIQNAAKAVMGKDIAAVGTPLYTDVRLFSERGIPGVIYGAGPKTVLESHAKRADERLELRDLRVATQVLARALHTLLG
jgi:succinyl-diaminopimelate desuccinylase